VPDILPRRALGSLVLLALSASAVGAEPPFLERRDWWPLEGGRIHGGVEPAALQAPGTLRLPSAVFETAGGEPALPLDLRFTEAEARRGGQPWIVQVAWPVAKGTRERLEGAGARVIGFVPNAAYLVRSDHPDRLGELPGVLWAGPYHPAYRLDPSLGEAPTFDPTVARGEQLPVRALLFEDASKAEAVGQLEALGARIDEAATWEPLDHDGRVYFLASPAVLLESLRLPGVRLIQEVALTGRLFAVETKPAIQSGGVFEGTPFHDAGILGVGHVAGIADSGLDVDTILLAETEADAGTVGPDHRKVLSYTAVGGGDLLTCSGMGGFAHGTNVTQNTLGNRRDFGLDGNLDGIAPGAKVVFFDLQTISAFACGFGLLNPPASLTPSYEDTFAAGGRVFNGSFGLGAGYNNHSTDADQYLWDHREAMWIFAAGNGGAIGSPATAKNVVAAGGYYQEPFFDFFGSNGPGPDGRMVPTIMAPACDNPGGNPAPFDFETSSSISNDDEDIVGPPTSTLSQGVCGTSFASPFTTGAAILVRDYFGQGFYPSGVASGADALDASGALVKAVFLNSGEFLPCAGCGGVRMSGNQGMGRLNLSLSLHLDGDARTAPSLRVVDRGLSDGLGTGDEHVEVVTITDPAIPLRATVVWIDQAQSLLVNDLQLLVTGPDGTPAQTYMGNNFIGAWSDSTDAGGTRADATNPFESVIIDPTGLVAGDWTVRVQGASVPMGDARFGGTQPFALVLSGGFGAPPTVEFDCCNGLDDDGDGDVDFDDSDCDSALPCSETLCDDGLDDDGDGDVDCADSDCTSDPACIESDCCNGLDDDGDGDVDFDDSDCAAAPPCTETLCDDGLDDDGDGDIDCDDADCQIDADGDGFGTQPCGSDCNDADPGAFAPPLEAADLLWTGSDNLAWDDQSTSAGNATTYALVRGRLGELPAGSGAAETCLDPALATPAFTDSATPPTSAGWWYLATAANSCLPAGAPWGTDSLGTPRAAACP